MVRYRHNRPYYELHFSQLEEDAVRVLSFQGEESISRLFRYRIELISEDPALDPADILNQQATFVFNRGDEDPVNIYGIISHFEQRGRTPNYVHYYAELVPRLWRLTLTKNSRVFQEMEVKDIVTQILDDSGFSGDDYDVSGIQETYPELEYVVQYNETDFDFINRRLEHFGIFYYFDHSGDKEVIVFTDANDSLPEIDLEEGVPYNPNRDPLSRTETLFDLTCQSRVVTGTVRLKDYNYRTPELDLTVEEECEDEAPGTQYEFGDHYMDNSEGNFLARVRHQEIAAQGRVFKGRGDCRLFHPGSIFSMGRHYRDEWNDMQFLLTRVISRGTQRSLFNLLPEVRQVIPTFENQFEAIPSDVDYRPPRITPVPRIPGIMSSKVETGSEDEYAYVDDEGRYKVKIPFDLSDAGNGEASRPVRLAQPYSGPGYGIHFPNHADTELIWSCINGDVDRPMGLGTVPNPSQSSPVTSENKQQSVIRTAAGSEIILDDTTDEFQITIRTPDNNVMLFDDKDDKIEITTKDGHVAVFDDPNKHINITTKDGHSFTLDDENKQISLVSKKEHWMSINDSDGGEMITLSDKDSNNYFVIDITNNKLEIMTTDGSIDMHAPNGTIDIQAQTLNVETSGKTKFKSKASYSIQASGDYSLKAGGDVKVESGKELNMKGGTDVKMESSQATEIKAGTDLKMEGVNTEITGHASLKAKGAMAEYKGSATARLEGGVVFIKGNPLVNINSG